MKYRKGKPFSSGTECANFLYIWCEKCKHYKLSDDGFPAMLDGGGCPILDAIDIDEFPGKDIVEEVDDDGNVVRFHICTRFESIRKE